MALLLAGALPLAWLVAGTARFRRRRALRSALHALPCPGGTRTRSALLGAGVLATALALGGSASGDPRDRGPGTVVLALDLSRSMAVRDGKPDRLATARAAVSRLLEEVPGGAGLVVFASRGLVLSPPGTPVEEIRRTLSSLARAAPGAEGSVLEAGLELALSVLEAAPEGPRHVVLVSDGETFGTQERLRALARQAREGGIRVHGILVGTEAGGPVPGTGGRSSVVAGELEAVAGETGGTLVRGEAVEGVARALRAGAASKQDVHGGGEADVVSAASGGMALSALAFVLLLAEAGLSVASPWRVG